MFALDQPLLHLLRGVSAYLVAPLWFALQISAALLSVHPRWGMRAGATGAAPAARVFDLVATTVVFTLALSFLITPKLLAFARMMRRPDERRRFGGARLAAANLTLETLLSTLTAPVIMLGHTRSLLAVLAGRDPAGRPKRATPAAPACVRRCGPTRPTRRWAWPWPPRPWPRRRWRSCGWRR